MAPVPALVLRLLLPWVALACPVAIAQPERPNVLLLMAEDMSARVGAFGDPVASTPNLDALAAEGVRYPNTFTTAGVCAPSRAGHILGMHQVATGTQHMRSSSRPGGGYVSVPPAQVKAYPELLRAAGYYTFTDIKLDYQFSGPRANSGPPSIWDEEGAMSADWRARDALQPFFGFRNFAVTHESGVFSPLGTMPNSVIHLVMQVMRWWSLEDTDMAPTDLRAVPLPPYYPDTSTVRADVARHYDNIAVMDAEVGAILAQLEADGLVDDTIVIWTTDHGDGLPRGKRELYDSGIRVPMIIRWPPRWRPAGAVPGSIDGRLISFIDLAPTILRLAGVDAPAYLQGSDFVAGEPREYIHASRDRIDEVPDRQRAVRDARYKYIRSWYPAMPGGHALAFRDNIDMVREMRALYEAGELDEAQRQWFEPVGEERLFDVIEDPFEVRNLAGDPAHAQVLARMREELARWQAGTGDMGDVDEAAMMAGFQSGGEQLQTPAPTVSLEEGVAVVAGADPLHSLEYRIGDGRWRLYVEPVPVPEGQPIVARAVRYGWATSAEAAPM